MENNLHLAIDATNIRSGGGLTHLSQLLSSHTVDMSRIGKITIWAHKDTLVKFPNNSWISKESNSWIERRPITRFFWQHFFLSHVLKNKGCDILFSPGGTIPFVINVPCVTMSQNMLPFENKEAKYFGRFSLMYLKIFILRHLQGRSFKRANGVIFLTKYAFNSISNFLDVSFSNKAVIPHGLEDRFFQRSNMKKVNDFILKSNKIKLLYVSTLMPYKHQCEVARAVKYIHDAGYKIEIKFVGEGWGWYEDKFCSLIKSLDPSGEFLIWKGVESFEDLHTTYGESDIFVFASSCENLPNILLEAMASSLPIACSNLGPMPEVLDDAGVYFDPVNIESIVKSLLKLITDNSLRNSLSDLSWNRAQKYSWDGCARDTFKFIDDTMTNYLKCK